MMSRKRNFLLMAAVFVIGLLLTWAITPVSAGGTVTSCSSDSEFSSKLAGGGTINFSCDTATILLSSTKTITSNTTINGGGTITLSGGGVRQLFVVSPGATLTLTSITIRDGYSSASDGGA